MKLKLGSFEISWKGKKSYSQLVEMLNRESGTNTTLNMTMREQLNAYKSWTYSCVSLISDRVSTLPYSFYNKYTGEELNTKNKGYKIFSKPFNHPNDLMSFRFIKSWCQTQLDLCGMTCIYKGINKLGQVWELWPLNMNEFLRVEVSNNSTLTSPKVRYIFTNMEFDINELIVIYYSHPNKPWEGMSPIQAQAFAYDIDNYVEIYERDFFKNSARIDMALRTDVALDEEKAEEIKQRWKGKFGGKFHDIAVLDSGLELVPLKYTNKDFEFIQLANWSKEKTCGAYRVPTNKLGSTESNRAGAVYTDISFNRESIQPRLTLWDEELTMGVCQAFDEKLEIRHKNPIPRDRQIELQEQKAYLSGIPTMTINEFRTNIHNYVAVENGDRILLKTGSSYIFLDELDKIPLEQRIGGTSTNSDSDDRSDEKPHTNPDGTDDRDDNTTDGRSVNLQTNKMNEFYSLVSKSRDSFNTIIFDYFKNLGPDKIKESFKVILYDFMKITVDALLGYFDSSKTLEQMNDLSEWIETISDKASTDYIKTLFNDQVPIDDWTVYYEKQHNSNVRLSKIINALIRSCVNYSKWLILNDTKQDIHWIVNNNECGHKGRIEKMITKDYFLIGKTRMRFPGELLLNFDCDCTISNNGGF